MPLTMFEIGDDVDRPENSLRYHSKKIFNIDPTFQNFVTTRHDICPKIYTATFSGLKFYSAKVHSLRHFSRKLTA